MMCVFCDKKLKKTECINCCKECLENFQYSHISADIYKEKQCEFCSCKFIGRRFVKYCSEKCRHEVIKKKARERRARLKELS